ncbi:hypothetical protein [Pseudoalteromonas distincta]|uniref:hypothetical protein n=1 Tax=Pseudoalteromonas distincta TaxID=77608 RepID=UPI00321B0025
MTLHRCGHYDILLRSVPISHCIEPEFNDSGFLCMQKSENAQLTHTHSNNHHVGWANVATRDAKIT